MPFYRAYGLSINSEIELPELTIADPTALCDLYIKKGEISLPKLKKTQIYRRGIRAFFGKDQSGNLILKWDDLAVFKAENGNELTVSPETNDANLLSLFTVSEALGMILFQRGYFLLHASAVQVGDHALCFMGSPGAGKSTTAAAFVKAGCTLLSDDLTAIKFDEAGNAYIIPGYPQLKIWSQAAQGLSYDRIDLQPVSEGIDKFSFIPNGEFNHEAVLLKEIFFLHKANNIPALDLLGAVQVPMETLKTFPLPSVLLTGESLKKHFIQSFQCAGSTKMWKKRRPAGFASLQNWVKEMISLHTELLQDVR